MKAIYYKVGEHGSYNVNDVLPFLREGRSQYLIQELVELPDWEYIHYKEREQLLRSISVELPSGLVLVNVSPDPALYFMKDPFQPEEPDNPIYIAGFEPNDDILEELGYRNWATLDIEYNPDDSGYNSINGTFPGWSAETFFETASKILWNDRKHKVFLVGNIEISSAYRVWTPVFAKKMDLHGSDESLEDVYFPCIRSINYADRLHAFRQLCEYRVE